MLDTHVLHWWTAEPDRLSKRAAELITAADEVCVSAISWYELAWLADHNRIVLAVPTRNWLVELSTGVRTAGVTAEIAANAVSLPETFPKDPADRLIYATAIENGWDLITKDQRLLEHPHPRKLARW
ncbi:MAG: type II toxin-antitoxin system VapC family toxin [Acidimicrobiales bacterium]